MPVDKSQQRVQRMFGEIAPRYDFLNHALSLQTDRYWRWRTVRRVVPLGDLPILDVCCGTGDLTLAFQRAVAKKRLAVEIVGADFCHEMLEIAREKLAKQKSGPKVRFIEADTLALPFEDGSFQIVSVAFGLRNVADTMKGLQEMVRVSADGGRVAVLEFSTPRRQPMRGLYGFYFRNILPKIGQLVARNSSAAYEYLPQSVGEFPQGKELAQMMMKAGLGHVDIHPLSLGVATLYVGTKGVGIEEPAAGAAERSEKAVPGTSPLPARTIQPDPVP